jgi:hypothetical protein
MPLTLIDGSAAGVDFTTGSAPVSWKCAVSYMSIDIGRRMEDRTTFCTSGGWASGVPTMKQAAIRLDGFLSTGETISDPLHLFASTSSVAWVATFSTSGSGSTLAGNMHAVGYHAGIRAQAASEMGMSAVSDGAITSGWVIA